MVDRERAEKAFRAYVSRYDQENSMIRLKAVHTFRVTENSERIALSLGMSDELVSIAWLLGLLHDIGRFEQACRYGTFLDAVSVDHAEFGAELLFKEGLIREFSIENLSEEWLILLETAIRLHNKLTLPDDLDERTRCFCDLIRDADKVDIFRVVYEMSFEECIGAGKDLFEEAEEASSAVMDCVRKHCCVPRSIRKTRFEGRISHGCMAFELVFPESRHMAREQGYLAAILAGYDPEGKPKWKEKERAQLRILQNEIEKAWSTGA